MVLLSMMLAVLATLDSLDPDGDGESRRARYRGWRPPDSWARKARVDGSRCFWGLAGSVCCMYYGGVEPEVLLRMYRREATRGSRGNAVGWKEGREVTMLAAGRDGLRSTVYRV